MAKKIIFKKIYLTFINIYELPEIIYDKSKVNKNPLRILTNPSELSKWYSAMYLYTYLDHYEKMKGKCNKINTYKYDSYYFSKISNIVHEIFERNKCLIPLLKQHILKKYYLFIPNIGQLTLGKIIPYRRWNEIIDDRVYGDLLNKFLPGSIKLYIRVKNKKSKLKINFKIEPEHKIGRDFVPITIKSSNKLKIIKKSLPLHVNNKTISNLDTKVSFFVRLYPVGAISINLNLYIGSENGITLDDIIRIRKQGFHSIHLIYKNKRYSINDFLRYILNTILNSILVKNTDSRRYFYRHTIIDIIESKPREIYMERYYRVLYGLIEATTRYYEQNDDTIVRKLINKIILEGLSTIITSPKTTLIIYHYDLFKQYRRYLRIKVRDLIEIEHVRKLAAKKALDHLNRLNSNLIIQHRNIKSELKNFMFRTEDIDPIVTAKIIVRDPIMQNGFIRGLQTRIDNSIKINEVINKLEKELNLTLSILALREPKIKEFINILIDHLF